MYNLPLLEPYQAPKEPNNFVCPSELTSQRQLSMSVIGVRVRAGGSVTNKRFNFLMAEPSRMIQP